MNPEILWARARLEASLGADPAEAEERYWDYVDRAYEEWRDTQLINRAEEHAQRK